MPHSKRVEVIAHALQANSMQLAHMRDGVRRGEKGEAAEVHYRPFSQHRHSLTGG
jgi:hypothetical protein